jgi:hypothetical protein
MSEPWLKLYVADMRADPKILSLKPAMRWALICAYDLAKNGPGDVAELRGSEGGAMTERELRTYASVSANETRAMFQRWSERGLCELVETVEGRLCVFPNLARRQGIDRTAADRMKRYRKRKRYAERYALSDAHVTGERYGPVTAEKPEARERDREDPSIEGSSLSAPPQKARPRDLIWDALVEECGYSPGTPTERGAWNKARKEIGDQPPGEVAAKAAMFKRRYPDLRCTPTALVRQWGALGEANGQPRQRTMAEVEEVIRQHEAREAR